MKVLSPLVCVVMAISQWHRERRLPYSNALSKISDRSLKKLPANLVLLLRNFGRCIKRCRIIMTKECAYLMMLPCYYVMIIGEISANFHVRQINHVKGAMVSIITLIM